MSKLSTKQLQNKIAKVINVEQSTRKTIGELSRELMEHYCQHGDVSLLNQLLTNDGLTQQTLKACRIFFADFIPHKVDKEGDNFFQAKKKLSDTQEAEAFAKIEAFLAVESNNVWSWAKKNVKTEKAIVNQDKVFTKSVKKILETKSPEYIINLLLDLDNDAMKTYIMSLTS